jgi:hypothetical protein
MFLSGLRGAPHVAKLLLCAQPPVMREEAVGTSIMSSSLAPQSYVGPGLPQKLLPAEVFDYCFFRFRDKSLYQGGVVSPTPWRADVFCQDRLP